MNLVANSGGLPQELTALTTAEGQVLSSFLLTHAWLTGRHEQMVCWPALMWVQLTERDVVQETEDDCGFLIKDGGINYQVWFWKVWVAEIGEVKSIQECRVLMIMPLSFPKPSTILLPPVNMHMGTQLCLIL